MSKLTIVIITILLVGGCATTPDHVQECDVLFSEQKDIQKCEKRVFAREDKIAREKPYYDKINSCKEQGLVAYVEPNVKRKDPSAVHCVDEADIKADVKALIGQF